MTAIAISAFVAPSRRLRLALGGAALVHLGAAVHIAAVAPERLAFAFSCALFFLLAAAFLLHGCASLTKTHQIDVSGTGTVRLTVQQKVGAGTAVDAAAAVRLLPGSLFWPQLMLLRLGDTGGRQWVVPVLRDSLAPDEYRALRVAFGTLCGRTVTSESASEIL
ncbi:MAG: protein YgfX [Pseudomonadota bacterium]